jgi:hypothetical protein
MIQYKSILNLTSAHLEGYEPQAPIHVSRWIKFRTVIAKLFPQTKRRGIEASLRSLGEILATDVDCTLGHEFCDSAETIARCKQNHKPTPTYINLYFTAHRLCCDPHHTNAPYVLRPLNIRTHGMCCGVVI